MSEPGTDLVAVTTEMPQAPQVTASTSVSDTPDFRTTLPDSNNINGLTIVLAIIAILGGRKAWDFYGDWSKRRHEQQMALIDKQCQTEDEQKKNKELLLSVQTKLSEIESEVNSLRQKDSSTGLGVSLDEVQSIHERLEKLEKSSKPKRKKN